MKDNFDLKKFLVENKMTVDSRRNDIRKHFLKEDVSTGNAEHDFCNSIRNLSGSNNDDPDTFITNAKRIWKQRFSNSVNYTTAKRIIAGVWMENSGYGKENECVDECDDVDMLHRRYASSRHHRQAPEYNLDEAGYTDDDDEDSVDDLSDFPDDDVPYDPRAEKAAKGAMKDTDLDDTVDEPEDDFGDESRPEGDEEDDDDFQEPEEISDKPNNGPLEHFDIKYNPETVELDFEGQEGLDAYLNSYKRPKVAARVLQRALDKAQREANKQIAFKTRPIYLVLRKGFYDTETFFNPHGGEKFIASVRRDPKAKIDAED
jgi:hypothetical protein